MNIDDFRALRRAGRHEDARALVRRLVASTPGDAMLQFEAACVHDFLGLEAQAVSYYRAALAGDLPAPELRSAYTGLGSTHRTLGQYDEAEAVLVQGLRRFPEAREIRVFLAMVRHNLGRSSEAVQDLLMLLVESSGDEHIRAYGQAIAFYAKDVDRSWP